MEEALTLSPPRSPVRTRTLSVESTAALPPPSQTLDEVRQQVVALVSTEALDKEAALTVTRLFHTMETLLRHECAVRDRKIADGENLLERERLQMRLAETTAPVPLQPTTTMNSTPRKRRSW